MAEPSPPTDANTQANAQPGDSWPAESPASLSAPLGVLIVDDEAAVLESLEMTLEESYQIFTATTGEEGLEVFDIEDIALVISDQRLPGMSGADFLTEVYARKPECIRLMLTGYADLKTIMRAINDGHIYGYIAKPWDPNALRLTVRHALDSYVLSQENKRLTHALTKANEKLEQENLYLRREVEGRYSFDSIIGSSPAMERVFEILEKVAQTDATVLVTGDTGTGKELIARAVHYCGSRKARPFVAQNCGALPETLLESELFGHKRGAFTGAHSDKKGLFELADRGTVFLDEIGETGPSMQVRLLRVLQEGEIRPLGTAETRSVDVRVVAATNRNLQNEVEEGRFREDLFYRLRVVEIHVPALSERRDDIPELAHFFLDRANEKMGRHLQGFTNGAMDRLVAHTWKGNVRELENEIERVVALSGDAERVAVDMLSEHVSGIQHGESVAPGVVPSGHLSDAVDHLKREMIRQALEETGNKSRAAESLGMPRQSLQKMMKRLKMEDV
ncbi:MAG: sigma-54-dependent Fis family transcriptional regulator [Deltaproteobacteria bacterium]|nr:sigma-54-dependent Fis family transcriptional regulator [Deltaproteobacteria bacterium]